MAHLQDAAAKSNDQGAAGCTQDKSPLLIAVAQKWHCTQLNSVPRMNQTTRDTSGAFSRDAASRGRGRRGGDAASPGVSQDKSHVLAPREH